MTIDIEPLRSLESLEACQELQRRILGDPAGGSVLGVPLLRAAEETGGLVLGARREGLARELEGIAVDLATTFDGFAAWFSLAFLVAPDARGRGVGMALRRAERSHAMARGVEVIRAWVDPLRSVDGHLLWNRLGAIGTRYERNVLGELNDRANRGMATDRVFAEWWVRSPRSTALVDSGVPASHLRTELHEMDVLTRTTVGASGLRILTDARTDVRATSALVEIPADVDRLREEAPSEAKRWRVGTREVFERLLGTGYLLAGLVHEGGRSFQWLTKTDRSDALGQGDEA